MSKYEGYTKEDNARRKANNIEEGHKDLPQTMKRVKSYGGSGPSAASKEAIKMKRKSKKSPVKIFTKEEIEEYSKQNGG